MAADRIEAVVPVAGASGFSRAAVLWMVGLAPLGASAVGSVFNIWYNLTQVRPLLSDGQKAAFEEAIGRYNLTAYPLVGLLWVAWVLSLGGAMAGRVKGEKLESARRRAINLPWINGLILAAGWLGCVPYFRHAVLSTGEPLHPDFVFQLSVSVLIAAMITVTHSVFLLELLTQKWLFPALFQGGGSPSGTRGAFTLSLGRRLLLWSVSAGICPIASLLLVASAQQEAGGEDMSFALAVGGVGILFGLAGAALLGRLLADPLGRLKRAAASVAEGDLSARVDLLRADEFGPLIDQFNRMIEEMRLKERLRETFGQHVGRAAAEQILAADPGLGGRERQVAVLFCDLRGFTARSESVPAAEAVWLLNEFFSRMVKVVEEDCGGMVNKFLGDGFMALFGAAGVEDPAAAAQMAVKAGRGMLRELEQMNRELLACNRAGLGMGVGVHVGPVILGNIGSAHRLEYTAIGDTVNVAARLQEMTRQLQCSMLVSSEVARKLGNVSGLRSLGTHRVRGREESLELFTPGGPELRQSLPEPPRPDVSDLRPRSQEGA